MTGARAGRPRRTVALAFSLTVASTMGCIPPIATPPLTSHEGETPIEVPYPPPPARVDVIADAPAGEDVVWVDGEWVWRGRRWIWEAGEWVTLAPDKGYAPPRVVRRSDGTLVWFEGSIRPLRGSP